MYSIPNADFDGDQIAVHLPLGNELFWKLNVVGFTQYLEPANGAPITVPSQGYGAWFVLYYQVAQGYTRRRFDFLWSERGYDRTMKKLDIHAPIMFALEDLDAGGNLVKTVVETAARSF